MSERELAVWLATRVLGLLAGLYLLHRLLLALEAQGLVYYRKNKPKPGGVTGAALEMERLIRPAVEHRIEAEETRVASDENDGGGWPGSQRSGAPGESVARRPLAKPGGSA